MHQRILEMRRRQAAATIREALASIAHTLGVPFPVVKPHHNDKVMELRRLEAWASVCESLIAAVAERTSRIGELESTIEDMSSGDTNTGNPLERERTAPPQAAKTAAKGSKRSAKRSS